MPLVDWIAPVRRSPQRGLRARALLCACALLCAGALGTQGRAETRTKIAVFPFELEDFSAAGGVVATNERDAKYLAEATQEAKRGLAGSGRYTLVDTANAQDEPAKTHTLHSCNGCVGPIAKKLGADQAVIGTVTRVSRTEYTLLLQVFDAASGELVARYFTGLRMGADYSWPRGAKWLVKHRILAKTGG